MVYNENTVLKSYRMGEKITIRNSLVYMMNTEAEDASKKKKIFLFVLLGQ